MSDTPIKARWLNINVHQDALPAWSVWFILWLFTVGYAKLGFFTSLAALFVWPYFLGMALAR